MRALATDDEGATGEDEITITVLASGGGNTPPVAYAGADVTVEDDDLDDAVTVTLDGSPSHDPTSGGSVVGYVWSEGGAQLGTGVTCDVEFEPGTHVITLTVTDDEGATDRDTFVITVLRQDDDGDGLADVWEIDYFGSTDVADGATDSDDDGALDVDEYLGGTDPTDASDVPSSSGTDGSGGSTSCVPGAGASPIALAWLAFVIVGIPRKSGYTREMNA